MANLDSILKSRDITLPTKVHLVKAMVFPVVVYRCESWTIKKAGHRRIDAFELWCWRRLLRVPWTARRSSQSILKEISPNIHWKDWCWSWNSSTLATWCKQLTHWKRLWFWERLKAGEEGDERGWDGWMVLPNRWTWVWVSSGSWWWTGKPGMLQSIRSQRVGHNWVTELNWPEDKMTIYCICHLRKEHFCKIHPVLLRCTGGDCTFSLPLQPQSYLILPAFTVSIPLTPAHSSFAAGALRVLLDHKVPAFLTARVTGTKT